MEVHQLVRKTFLPVVNGVTLGQVARRDSNRNRGFLTKGGGRPLNDPCSPPPLRFHGASSSSPPPPPRRLLMVGSSPPSTFGPLYGPTEFIGRKFRVLSREPFVGVFHRTLPQEPTRRLHYSSQCR